MMFTRLGKGGLAEPARTAAYWVARRRLNLMTPADERAFESWRAEPQNAADYAAAEATVSELGAVAEDAAVRRMRAAALAAAGVSAVGGESGSASSANVLASRRALPLLWRTGAAVAALLVAIMLYAGLWRADTPSEITAADFSSGALESRPVASLGSRRYVTNVGEIASYTLVDGSEISLNTDSVVEVSYSPSRRTVLLQRGQALFHVAKDKSRPFVVTAGDRLVTAVGTAFDVRLDAHAVKVVLVEGRVTVDPARRTGIDRVFPVLTRWSLEPGEELTSAPDQTVAVFAADTDRATSWERGRVIFRDDTLAVAVAEMNRYSATPLVLQDGRLAALRISGVFSVNRPEDFIAALADYYPVAVRESPSGSRVLVWNKASSPKTTLAR